MHDCKTWIERVGKDDKTKTAEESDVISNARNEADGGQAHKIGHKHLLQSIGRPTK